ncbi:MAG: hypothetical protein M3040_04260, partial [Bacteroidota bacterium]|nr:hypothetical protein [Bacteroidota bacterium]
MNKVLPFTLLFCFFSCTVNARQAVSDTLAKVDRATKTEMRYNIGNGKTLIYKKPKKFAFITSLPKDAAGIVSATFNRKSITPLAAIAAGTAALILSDQLITDGVEDFSKQIHLSPDEKNHNVIVHFGGKDVALLRFPGNLNTAFYQ